MLDDYRFGLPLKNPTIRYVNGGTSEGLSLSLIAQMDDLTGAKPFGSRDVANEISIQLIDYPVTQYYETLMGDMMKPIARFPNLVGWFSDYKAMSWIYDWGDGAKCYVIAQIPSEPTFRNTLVMALLNGQSIWMNFTARFAERGDAPAPTIEAYRQAGEPVFDQSPVFWISAGDLV